LGLLIGLITGVIFVYMVRRIERVARQWKDGAAGGPEKVPIGGTPPELIEDPVVIPGF